MRALVTCLLLVVALGIAGCGEGDSEADGFSGGYNAAIERLGRVNQELAGLEASSKSRSNRAIGRGFDRFADAVGGARSDLARLEPPARQRRAVRELREATGEIVAAEDALSRAVETTG